ncbi:unnamed protein product [Prorocentrum cordatum]|uniref:Uncharacterized protein n=1 Tax=Prorocentrum cordatum TaxID=2364126 RepID=A0ABN9Q717_9DINO|nr:unnamed protein product [Polarella glacialis]
MGRRGARAHASRREWETPPQAPLVLGRAPLLTHTHALLQIRWTALSLAQRYFPPVQSRKLHALLGAPRDAARGAPETPRPRPPLALASLALFPRGSGWLVPCRPRESASPAVHPPRLRECPLIANPQTPALVPQTLSFRPASCAGLPRVHAHTAQACARAPLVTASPPSTFYPGGKSVAQARSGRATWRRAEPLPSAGSSPTVGAVPSLPPPPQGRILSPPLPPPSLRLEPTPSAAPARLRPRRGGPHPSRHPRAHGAVGALGDRRGGGGTSGAACARRPANTRRRQQLLPKHNCRRSAQIPWICAGPPGGAPGALRAPGRVVQRRFRKFARTPETCMCLPCFPLAAPAVCEGVRDEPPPPDLRQPATLPAFGGAPRRRSEG